MNVVDLAATRYRPIRKALERIAKAEAARAESLAGLGQLRTQVGPAEHADRRALGAALVDGKAEPASETAKLKAEIAQEERRVDALALAVDDARGQISKLVSDNRAVWRGDAMRELSRAHVRYLQAIDELEAAREALSGEATLVSWLDGGAGAEAASDPLGGRGQGAPVNFSQTLEQLRQDAEAIAAHPVTRDDPAAEPRLELAWRA